MYEVHIETWMYDAETADYLVTDEGWLAAWATDAADKATLDGKTVTGSAVFRSHTLIGPGPDNGLMYDVIFDVPVTDPARRR